NIRAIQNKLFTINAVVAEDGNSTTHTNKKLLTLKMSVLASRLYDWDLIDDEIASGFERDIPFKFANGQPTPWITNIRQLDESKERETHDSATLVILRRIRTASPSTHINPSELV